MRGTYSDLVDFNVYKIAGMGTNTEAFSFDLNNKSKKEPSPAGLKNFLDDVRKIAKKEGYAEAKTPDEIKSIKGKAFLLGRTSKGIKLLVKEMS